MTARASTRRGSIGGVRQRVLAGVALLCLGGAASTAVSWPYGFLGFVSCPTA
ncbi:Uncharacterised protein [Arthrobacter agilis]|nr:Uncharacterised protein [Arthrobacter agilis]